MSGFKAWAVALLLLASPAAYGQQAGLEPAPQARLASMQGFGPPAPATAPLERQAAPSLDGAHQFLAEVAKRGTLQLFFGKNDQGGGYYQTWIRVAVASTGREGDCVSVLTLGPVGGSGGGMRLSPSPTRTIDWSKVNKVTAFADYVQIDPPITQGLQMMSLVPGSAELTKRLGTALEFIRVSCDTTRHTGF